jgi:hypothetical protein
MVRTHKRVLLEVHPWLRKRIVQPKDQDVFLYAFQGLRSRALQEAAYRNGNSNARYGYSWHNVVPSLGIDVVPLWIDNARTIEWDSDRTKQFLRKFAKDNPDLEWGGTWVTFRGDIYHFQPAGLPKHPTPPALQAKDYFKEA